MTPLDSLEILGRRRGLEDLHLTSNLSMLRLLDLPAVLELRSSATAEPVYAALIGIDDDSVTLQVGGEMIDVSPAVLNPVWFGDAHVFWRDFEWLGPTFGREANGSHVTRLQQLLAHAGLFDGPATGKFDDEDRGSRRRLPALAPARPRLPYPGGSRASRCTTPPGATRCRVSPSGPSHVKLPSSKR